MCRTPSDGLATTECQTRDYICDMKFTLQPDPPFSLGAAAAFGFGPRTGRPKPVANAMNLAFVTDDMRHHAGAHLTQDPDGAVTVDIDSDADGEQVLRQVRRIVSLDHPGAAWAEVGARDPVIGGLQREHEGLRPVLFHSPYEAAAWSIISARRHRAQAAAIRDRNSAVRSRSRASRCRRSRSRNGCWRPTRSAAWRRSARGGCTPSPVRPSTVRSTRRG